MRIGGMGKPHVPGSPNGSQDNGIGPNQTTKKQEPGRVGPSEQGQIPARDDLHPNSFNKLLYRPEPPDAKQATSRPGPLRKALDQTLKSERRLDHYLNRAMRGHVSDLNELLVLQMRVYRYTQQVEVLSRVVDRTTSSIKQVLQTRL